MRQRGFQISDIYAHAYHVSKKSPLITYTHLTHMDSTRKSRASHNILAEIAAVSQALGMESIYCCSLFYLRPELTSAHRHTHTYVCVHHKRKPNRTFLSVCFSLLPCRSGPLTVLESIKLKQRTREKSMSV